MQVKDVKGVERFEPARMAKVNLFETARFFCSRLRRLP